MVDNRNVLARTGILTNVDDYTCFLRIRRKFTSMMIQEKLILTQDRPILKQIIDRLGLNYTEFAKKMEIALTSLEYYRRGTRQFKLSTRQFKILLSLLREVGLTIEELPDDWIVER
jgi:predicted transcriptional regulator